MSQADNHWKRPQAPHTKVKSAIVAKYTVAWGMALSNRTKGSLVYLDLYSGPGHFDDGTPSTPLLVLGACANNPVLAARVKAVFNDVKLRHTKLLESAIDAAGYAKKLQLKPEVFRSEVGELLAQSLDGISMCPTFCFIDPYGFKGLSRKLIHAVIKDWGSDCLLFLHTSGINRNLFEQDSDNDLELLFGRRKLEELRRAASVPGADREPLVLEAFVEVSREEGVQFIRPMQFNFPDSDRISHHLVFLTKRDLGIRIMKSVMAGFSGSVDGVPNYIYVEGREESAHDITLEISGPIVELKRSILEIIGKAQISVANIVQQYDAFEGPATEKNIKDCLRSMEGRDITISTAEGKKRRAGTMADHLIVCRKR